MDGWTVLASAVIAAVVSAGVSLATAGVVTARQRKAEAAVEARGNLAALVADTIRELRAWQYSRTDTALQRGRPDSSQLAWASEMVEAAGALPGWRSFLVMRRLHRLLGPAVMERAELVRPGDTDAAFGQVAFGRQPDSNELGTLYAATTGKSGAALVDKVIRDLRMIGRAR